MVTGVFFIPRSNGGSRRSTRYAHRSPVKRAAKGAGRKLDRTKLDALAEALANGAPTLIAASREIGVPPRTGDRLFAIIKKELGWQAV